MPLCVISVSLVAPVSRMVRMLWLLDQSLNTALNMTLDLRTPTARCPSMKITKNQEVSTNILLKKLLKLLFIDWLIVIIYSYSHFLNLSLRSIWCIWRAASRGVRCAERMWEWTVCAVQEGYTCDCFDGYTLDMSRMACVGEQQHMIMCHMMRGSACGWD